MRDTGPHGPGIKQLRGGKWIVYIYLGSYTSLEKAQEIRDAALALMPKKQVEKDWLREEEQ